MDELFKFNFLSDVLERFARELEAEYKGNLKTNNRIASGTLHNTARAEVISVEKGNYTIQFHLQEYWEWVETGRPKTRNGGTGILKENILEWINVKQIMPTPVNGKLPTPRQLAYIISKKIHEKIHEKVYKGTQDMGNALDNIYSKYITEIYEAIDKDFDSALIHIFKRAPFKVQ